MLPHRYFFLLFLSFLFIVNSLFSRGIKYKTQEVYFAPKDIRLDLAVSRRGKVISLSKKALLLQKKNKYNDASDYFLRAVKETEKIKTKTVSKAYNNFILARHYLLIDNLAQAQVRLLSAYEETENFLKEGGGKKNDQKLAFKLTSYISFLLARLDQKEGRLKKALRAYERLNVLVEKITPGKNKKLEKEKKNLYLSFKKSNFLYFVYYRLGEIYLELNQLDKAFSYFEKIPKKTNIYFSSHAYFQMGYYYFKKNDFKKALKFYKKVNKKSSIYVDALFDQSLIFKKQNKSSEKFRTYQKMYASYRKTEPVAGYAIYHLGKKALDSRKLNLAYEYFKNFTNDTFSNFEYRKKALKIACKMDIDKAKLNTPLSYYFFDHYSKESLSLIEGYLDKKLIFMKSKTKLDEIKNLLNYFLDKNTIPALLKLKIVAKYKNLTFEKKEAIFNDAQKALQATDDFSKKSEIAYALAHFLRMNQKFEQAKNHYKMSFFFNPEAIEAVESLFKVAYFYMGKKNDIKVEMIIDKIINIYPDKEAVVKAKTALKDYHENNNKNNPDFFKKEKEKNDAKDNPVKNPTTVRAKDKETNQEKENKDKETNQEKEKNDSGDNLVKDLDAINPEDEEENSQDEEENSQRILEEFLKRNE